MTIPAALIFIFKIRKMEEKKRNFYAYDAYYVMSA